MFNRLIFNLPNFRSAAKWVELVIITLAAVLSFTFTVEVPVSDDWDIVPIIQKMRNGTLDWATLDAPYAGQKMPVSEFALAATAVATHWNSYGFRVLNFLIFVAAWLAIRPYASRYGILVPAAVVFWSWDQWVAWLWTDQMVSTIAVCFLLWSLRLLMKPGWLRFVSAMVLALAATLSHGGGLAVWVGAGYLLFIAPGWGDPDRNAAAGVELTWRRILFCICVCFAVYLFFIQNPAKHSAMMCGGNFLHMPLYYLMVLGSPLAFPKAMLSLVFGVAALFLLLVNWPVRNLRSRPFAAALLIVSLTMAGLITLARGGANALVQATDSRYGTIAALAWVGLLLVLEWKGTPRQRILICILAFCSLRSVTRLKEIYHYKQWAQSGAWAILVNSPARYEIIGGQTTPAELDADIEMAREWHYSLFQTGTRAR